MGQPEKQPKICKSPRSGTILPPIPKGQTRNPAGYSKKSREKDEFKAVCAEIWKDAPKDLINAVKAGVGSRKYDFVREGLERFFGKVPNKNELTGKDGAPIELSVSVLSADAQSRIDEMKKRLSE